jgi:hypothetical protein
MIDLPDLSRNFEYENGFYLTAEPQRFAKFIALYELYKKIAGVPGDIVECGVFKGASFMRLVNFRALLESHSARKRVIGFDTFGKFPLTSNTQDLALREEFINVAGDESIGKEQFEHLLAQRKISNVELIDGLIEETAPAFVQMNPKWRISLLHIDTDLYEPAKIAMEVLYPHIVKGGLLVMDNYGVFPGETKAVNEALKEKKKYIKKSYILGTMNYLVCGG